MSVMMGLRMGIDPDRFEEVIQANPDRLQRIAQQARDAGCIHHAFYANEDGGELLVVDEWPDRESFMGFFESSMDEIGPMMTEAGMTERPTPVFWRRLDTPDAM
jgi:Antibiotic biosynthesis monooxygenase